MVDEIDVHLGELSQFHETFGFYVHGLSIDAAVLPIGWEKRTIAVSNDNTRHNTGWCIEAHDLAASKLVAFRDKDRDFVRVLLSENLIEPHELVRRLGALPMHSQVTPQLQEAIAQWIRGVVKDMGIE